MQVNQYDFDTLMLQIKAEIEPEQLRYMKLSGQQDYLHNSYVVRALRNFASSKPVDECRTSTEYTTIQCVPTKTLVNYFRLLVTTFCSDLNFGWLKPEYRSLEVPHIVYNNYKSYNLYPLTDDDLREQFGRRWRVAKMTGLDTVQWLTECRPLTAEVRHVNVTNSYEVCDDYRDSIGYPRR
jgi:hypothetical protein